MNDVVICGEQGILLQVHAEVLASRLDDYGCIHGSPLLQNVHWSHLSREFEEELMRAGEVYVNPASGERAVVVLGTDETDGKRLVVDLYLRPNGGMIGRHYHPAIREQFRVVKGSLAYTLNGVEKSATVGQSVDVAPGTLHDFWNPGAEEALIRVDVQPAERFAELIKNGFSLAQDGKTDHTGKPGMLQIALMAREFDDVIRYDKGPRAVQQVLFLLLTPFAKAKGLRGSYPEYLARPASEVLPLDQLDRSNL